MRWTGTIEAATTCDTSITSVDFLPTFAALTGAELPNPQPVDGIDVTNLITGSKVKERSIFWHYPLYLKGSGLEFEVPGGKTFSRRGFPSTSLRKGQWKMIEFLETDTVGLYNLEDDPAEQNNLADSMPKLVAQLRAEIDAWRQKTKAPIPRERNPGGVLD